MTYDNELVVIDFLDHTEGEVGPCKFRIVGKLIGETEDAYCVENWINIDPEFSEEIDPDSNRWFIVKNAVTAIYGVELRPWTSPPSC